MTDAHVAQFERAHKVVQDMAGNRRSRPTQGTSGNVALDADAVPARLDKGKGVDRHLETPREASHPASTDEQGRDEGKGKGKEVVRDRSVLAPPISLARTRLPPRSPASL